MYCFLYYVHGTHNLTTFASSHVNQHLYEYDDVRCELFADDTTDTILFILTSYVFILFFFYTTFI